MLRAIHEKVMVRAGGVIEIRSDELPPAGALADVVVTFEAPDASPARPPMTDFIGAWRGVFQSSEAADQWLNSERDSWGS